MQSAAIKLQCRSLKKPVSEAADELSASLTSLSADCPETEEFAGRPISLSHHQTRTMSLGGMSLLLLTLRSLIADSTIGEPCRNYTTLDQPWRSSNCFETQCSGQWMHDGRLTEGWYRFSSYGNVKIPETLVPFYHCSAWRPGWLKEQKGSLNDLDKSEGTWHMSMSM
ncbi:oncoprotein-induced transcript 3 protein-like [Hypanus sabinus]|uniref:oncoprotein-induced transcript 3 protein-like n=1 Tax=Hypanus sabinus TaxID=79690 RepID=UPI0028C41AFE|nr:oncoprotein-induced transcript 3 protein-like [Hypanus sabinus]